MDAIDALLIALKARRDAASGFISNNNMIVEAKLLDAEIEALEKAKED